MQTIFFVIYPGFELLDLSGPSAAFSTANQLLPRPVYDIHCVSSTGGPIPSSSGIVVQSTALDSLKNVEPNTIFVVGATGAPVSQAAGDNRLLNWLRHTVPKAKRFGSICSGTFVLAAAGLLEHKTVTTHWAGRDQLAIHNPSTCVESDALYVNDDQLWTSAGVTTGLDMALEMVRQDHGSQISQEAARYLVVYAHRPGHQTQFSTLLQQQGKLPDDYSNLMAWIDANLHRSIRVADMADQMCQSERSFHRKFERQLGISPAKHLEHRRLERARELLEQKLAIARVCEAVGYRSEAAFRKSFKRYFGVSPSHHQRMHTR